MVSYPIVRAGWHITPKVGLHMSQYDTQWHAEDNPGYQNYPAGFLTYPRTQSRVVPIMSIDSGMVFERDTTLFGNVSVQTLEPLLYYLRVRYWDKSHIPTFDTYYSDFNFEQAFDENVLCGCRDNLAVADPLK